MVHSGNSYLSPVLGLIYIRIAECAFPTSAWWVEMWVFWYVRGEDGRDLVKDGMWTGEVCV